MTANAADKRPGNLTQQDTIPDKQPLQGILNLLCRSGSSTAKCHHHTEEINGATGYAGAGMPLKGRRPFELKGAFSHINSKLKKMSGSMCSATK